MLKLTAPAECRSSESILSTDTDINPTQYILITVLKYGLDGNKSSVMDTTVGSLMEMEPFDCLSMP